MADNDAGASATSSGQAAGTTAAGMQDIPSTSEQQEAAAPSPTATVAAAAAPIYREDARESADAEGRITVNVKFIHHENVSLFCTPSIPVAELRQKVMEIECARASSSDGNGADGSDQSRLRLIYKGKVLKDGQALNAYHFQDGDTIHAVFGRPPAAPASASATATGSQEQPSDSGQRTDSVRGEVQDLGNGLMVGQIRIDSDPEGPELGRLIGSMISNAFHGVSEALSSATQGGSSSAGFTSESSTTAAASTSPAYAGVTSSATSEASSITTSAWTTASAPSAASTTASASSPVQTASMSEISPARAHFLAQQASENSGARSSAQAAAPRGVSPARMHFLAQQASARESRASGAAALQEQASAVRRMMPPLDLGPMTRPPALCEEMYDLGNAVREASDTFLALHRQLAYLSSRLLNHNNLSSLELARLRMQMLQLGPALRGSSRMATSLDDLLTGSSLGWPARITPRSTSNAGDPPPPPTPGAGAGTSRSRSDRGANADSAAGEFPSYDSLQRGTYGAQPGNSEPVDAGQSSLPSTLLRERLDRVRSARDQGLRAADGDRRTTQRMSGSATVSSSASRQSRDSETTARRPSETTSHELPPFGNREQLSSALGDLQRVTEDSLLNVPGMSAFGPIVAETRRLLGQTEATIGALNGSLSAPSQAATVIRDTAPSTIIAPAPSLSRTQAASNSLPVISTTPISDLVAASLSRCLGSLEGDISEFYRRSSDYMCRMFPANEPEHEIRERRKEWRVRAMNEIETKAAFCCDEELVCRDDLLSPAMDAALDAFIRECLNVGFLSSAMPADSPDSPIHNAWIQIWSNVRRFVHQQPSSTGKLILSRILVEEIRGIADDHQDLCRMLYDRTMECATLVPEQDALSARA